MKTNCGMIQKSCGHQFLWWILSVDLNYCLEFKKSLFLMPGGKQMLAVSEKDNLHILKDDCVAKSRNDVL